MTDSPRRRVALFFAVATGYGLLQERILKGTYGEAVAPVRFRSPLFLVFVANLFSVVCAVAFAFYTYRASAVTKFKPREALWKYGLVGLFRFLASWCELLALANLSFTLVTASYFAQPFFVVPLSCLLLESEFAARKWTAAWLSLVGSLVFLLCLPVPVTLTTKAKEADDEVVGFLALICFRVLDAVRGFLHETFFPTGEESKAGENSATSVWISLPVILLSSSTFIFVSFSPTAHLLSFSPTLRLHVTLFSSLFFLLHLVTPSPTTHHPLPSPTSSSPPFWAWPPTLLVAAQKALGVAANAATFGTAKRVSFWSWCGFGWAVAAAWIRDDPRYSDDDDDEPSGRKDDPSGFHQILLPLIFPVLFIIFLRGLFLSSTPPDPNALLRLQLSPGRLLTNSSSGVVILEGGKWEEEFHGAVKPVCLNATTRRWQGERRTVLASNPRSGNTWARELVERTTGWQTSTESYCDHALEAAFLGECDGPANFLVKTHWPRVRKDLKTSGTEWTHRHAVKQAVHLIRNPVDSIYSEWHLANYPKKNGVLDHAGRLPIGPLGTGMTALSQRRAVLNFAEEWARHEDYWSHIEIPVHKVRYEDLIDYKLPTVMSLLAFLLPPTELPSLSHLACLTEQDAAREAYKSRKKPAFGSWDDWHPKLREEMLQVVKKGWCRHGYDLLLRDKKGTDTGVNDICR